MKFRCERDTLIEAVGIATRAVGSRGSSLPILSGLRFELAGDDLRLLGTDLDLAIAVDVKVSGGADGVAVIPARLVSEIVRALEPGAVTVEVGPDTAAITAGRSQFSLRVIPPDDFPRPTEPAGEAVTLAVAELAGALRQVVPAASADDSRPILTGVLLAAEDGGLRLVATDSYRLAVRDLPGARVLEEGAHVLVPSRALNELTRILGGDHQELTLRLGEREAAFELGNVRLTTRLIEGEFPNYRGLIPQSHPNVLTVNRIELLDAVRRTRLMAREATPLRMVMKPEGLELVAITQDVGQAHEELDAVYDGEALTVAFNPDYLVDGLEVAPGEQVTLHTVDALKPALLRGSGTEFLYLLMPVRVS
ncbi:MAG: DNA polymerase III subunit beta [Acidimicrobiales bacterium]